ncbi:MAG: HD domain-containing protein, partial [Lachnospiraceae bacterium]|nr:HD domain-containing protein [Lachnospiraceae bacterium]
IDAVKSMTYVERDGSVHPWLTEDEYIALTIRKGTLSNDERAIMESHVSITDKLLSKIKFSRDLSHVREWAASHHEFLNGTGYPKHLSGDEISYEVRIITILDIFDALVADDRPYKPGMPIDRALTILTAMAEKEGKLDPKLTKLFVESRCWESEKTAVEAN